MKSCALRLPGLAAAMLAACSTQPPPALAPRIPTQGADRPAAAADLGLAVRKALDGDWEAHYFDAAVDLNGDGAPEAVVYTAGPMVCGTGGCPLFVFTPAAGGYRLISSTSVVQPPVRVAPRSSHGWRSLVVGIGGGGIKGGHAELKFDGRSYPPNPTVPPAEPSPDLAGTQVLIPAFGSYYDGKPVPRAGS
jgi:hypothetical protein